MFALNNDFVLSPSSVEEVPSQLVTSANQSSEKAANNWLLDQNPENYTLQLLAISKQRKAVLDKLIFKFPKLQKDLRYFTSSNNGEQKLILIYGSFATASAAEEASKLLPPVFHKFWLRSFKGLQNKTSTISQLTEVSSLIKKAKRNVEKQKNKKTAVAKVPARPIATLADNSQWVLKQKPSNFTLQLAVISKQRKNTLSPLLKKHKQLHYFSRVKNGQEQYILVYGSYTSRAIAKQAMKKLPKTFSKPWLRTFKAFQNEFST